MFSQIEHEKISRPVMGTMAWAARHDRPGGEPGEGRLSPLEKAKLGANLARMQLLEYGDTIASILRMSVPSSGCLEALAPPETALTHDSLSFVLETHAPDLVRHCWRTYFFAVLLAEYVGLDVDREILFAATILHDTGLARDRPAQLDQCCFAVSGARRARMYLVSRGHSRTKARVIGDAICAHLNGYVSVRRHGAVAHLVSRGAMCDVFGFGHRRISRQSIEDIMKAYSRTGLVDALEITTGHHLVDTRPAILTRLGGRTAPKSTFDRFGN